MELVELEERLAEHEDMLFPEFPDDEAFADWVEELFEIDDYYFGLLSSIAQGQEEAIDKNLFNGLKDNLEQFADIKSEQKIYRDSVAYLDSLENLIDMVI